MATNESESGDSTSSMGASDSPDGSAFMTKPKRSRSGIWFRVWSFHATIKADLSQGTSAQHKARLLKDHLSNRIAHAIKHNVTSISTYCDESQLCGQTDREGLVSIVIHGYVQTKQATPISTMEKLFDSATWKPVPGGLAGDAEFRANSASLAKLYAFGEIGLNNQGRSEKSQEQKRAKQVQPIPIIESFSLLPLLFSYYAFYSALLSKSFCGA